jgi:hypothetical protein
MTLHFNKVDGRVLDNEGTRPVPVPAGWHIADGDADDARVCGAHPWQSHWLLFANGDFYGTAMYHDPSKIGAYAQLT